MNIERFEKWEPLVKAWEAVGKPPETEAISVGIKDNINTLDFPTQRGSAYYKGFTPGNDARVVSRLKEAGYHIAGKTVTAEFGVHYPGPTRNPHHGRKTPGTSSSGSAVAVACGMVPITLGTQTAGSIIRPASWCGVYAFKPSFGLVPRTGVLKTADTLDTVGFFAETPQLLKQVFDVCRVDGLNYPQTKKLRQGKVFKNIGFYLPKSAKNWPEYVKWEFESLQYALEHRFKCFDVGFDVDYFRDLHTRIYHKSLSYYFKGEYESGLISDRFKSQVEDGKKITKDDYLKDLKSQENLADLTDELLKSFDVLLTPSSGGQAPNNEEDAPLDSCALWTMTGVPVLNVPMFISPSGLPFGLSVISRKYNDYRLFEFVDILLEMGLAPKGPNPKLY